MESEKIKKGSMLKSWASKLSLVSRPANTLAHNLASFSEDMFMIMFGMLC